MRQFKLPKLLLAFLAFIFVSSAAYLTWIFLDYRSIKSQIPLSAQLRQENIQQKNQIIHLARRIDQITQKMIELKEFDRKLRVMVNLEPSEDDEPLFGVGGSDPLLLDPKNTVVTTHKDFVRLMHNSLDNLDHEVVLGERDKKELLKFLESQKMLLASTPSIWPTKGWMSSRFGYRKSPFTGKKEFHKGLDISTRMGAPIIAPANGMVLRIYKDRGYGTVLTVKHANGLVTKYAHLKKCLVKKGQHIKRGETIALVGNSGRSTGPHLHYEVHLNRVPVNPLHYILN